MTSSVSPILIIIVNFLSPFIPRLNFCTRSRTHGGPLHLFSHPPIIKYAPNTNLSHRPLWSATTVTIFLSIPSIVLKLWPRKFVKKKPPFRRRRCKKSCHCWGLLSSRAGYGEENHIEKLPQLIRTRLPYSETGLSPNLNNS